MYRLTLLLLTAACVGGGSEDLAVHADRIRALESAWRVAAGARDVDGMVAAYADDARQILPNQPPIAGRQAIRELFRGLVAGAPRFVHAATPDSILVARAADLALVTGSYRFTPDSLDPLVFDAGTFVSVWKGERGDWRLMLEISNSDLPADAPASSDPTTTDVRAALTSYYAAFSDRDWTRFARHFWPGATITTVWQPPGESAERVWAQTVPAFVAQAPAGPGSREIFEERMLTAEVRVRGTLAVAFARYRARFGDPGDIAEWEGTDAFTLMRHGGVWRITSLAFASDP